MTSTDAIDLSRAPLLSHLLELRRRLLHCLLVLTILFVICYLNAESIYHFLMQPLVDAFGEESGRLEEMLAKVADYYEAQVDALVDTLAKQIEPLIMAVLGGIVGSLVIAMYLPIFKLGAVV